MLCHELLVVPLITCVYIIIVSDEKEGSSYVNIELKENRTGTTTTTIVTKVYIMYRKMIAKGLVKVPLVTFGTQACRQTTCMLQ